MRQLTPPDMPTTLDAAKKTQAACDDSLGDEKKADELLVPLSVYELDQAEARALWPDFRDTEPGEL